MRGRSDVNPFPGDAAEELDVGLPTVAARWVTGRVAVVDGGWDDGCVFAAVFGGDVAIDVSNPDRGSGLAGRGLLASSMVSSERTLSRRDVGVPRLMWAISLVGTKLIAGGSDLADEITALGLLVFDS